MRISCLMLLSMVLMACSAVVSTAPIELLGSDGKPRARLGVDTNGNASLLFLRADGAIALSLGMTAMGLPELKFQTDTGAVGMRLGLCELVTATGRLPATPTVGLYAGNSLRCSLAMLGGEPQLALYDASAIRRLSLGLVGDEPRVSLSDTNGRTRIDMSLNAFRGPAQTIVSEMALIQLVRPDGAPALLIQDEGFPSLSMWDPRMPANAQQDAMPKWVRLSLGLNSKGVASALFFDAAGGLIGSIGKP